MGVGQSSVVILPRVSAVGLAEAETMQSALLCPDCMARAVEAYPAVNDG